MQDESFWIEKAQTAEAKFNTLQQSVDRIREDARNVLETFSARKKPDGSFDIDYKKFVERLGKEGAMELKRVIDEQYGNGITTDWGSDGETE